ncbi:hypothetical protein TNCV_3200141 [Trichonephila clavipes]|nr:hypothetical protein TNCV_3200141 [Trichonephila clavipes]
MIFRSFCFGASRQPPGAAWHGRGERRGKRSGDKRKQSSTKADLFFHHFTFCFGASRQKPGAAWHGRGERRVRHVRSPALPGTDEERGEVKGSGDKRKQSSTKADLFLSSFHIKGSRI